MYKIEHIGIAVNDLDHATKNWEALLGVPYYKTETVESEGVSTVFFNSGQNKVELLGALEADTPVGKYLIKNGEGIHHIAFRVDDIRAEMKRLKEQGFHLLSDEPKKGADNKWVCFVHPKSANGVLFELCQEIAEGE